MSHTNGPAEASRIGADVARLAHHTWDEDAGTDRPLPGSGVGKPHIPNLTGTPQAYSGRSIPPGRNRWNGRDYEA